MSNRKQGTVKWFNTEKGYGFILSPEGEDVFVHYRAILLEGFKNLREGQNVTYLQVKSEKGWQAAEVEVAEADIVDDTHEPTDIEDVHEDDVHEVDEVDEEYEDDVSGNR